MSYQIDYQASQYKRILPNKRKTKRRTYFFASVFVIVLIIIAIFPQINRARLHNDISSTEAAFHNFAKEMKDGVGVRDAFADFCKEIIANAELS